MKVGLTPLTLPVSGFTRSGRPLEDIIQKKEELQQAKAEAEEALRCKAVDIADPQVVRDYANDLRGITTEVFHHWAKKLPQVLCGED